MYESGEMYLETILLLQNELGTVRSIDVARRLEFSKPSVSRAMGLLKTGQYIIIDGNGHIVLTEKGLKTATNILEKHRLITQFLALTTNVPIKIAEEDACRMEHIISDEVMNGIKAFLKNNS